MMLIWVVPTFRGPNGGSELFLMREHEDNPRSQTAALLRAYIFHPLGRWGRLGQMASNYLIRCDNFWSQPPS
jgi:hypothetical protein